MQSKHMELRGIMDQNEAMSMATKIESQLNRSRKIPYNRKITSEHPVDVSNLKTP